MRNVNLRRDEAAQRSGIINVESYDVRLDLRSAVDSLSDVFASSTTITFGCTEPGAETFLDFISDDVREITLNGRGLPAAEVVDGARIRLPGLAEWNTVTVKGSALFSRSGEGLHRYVDPADSRTYLYTQYEPADARRVFANFEQPDLKASFTFHITAPSAWTVASNSAESSREPVDGDSSASVWHFAPTQRISTYITTVLAGPYFSVADHWSGTMADGSPLEIPLGAYCRASLADAFDADRIFDVTRRGLDYFHVLFDYPYPFGKYDQAFVPEYNLGAMENPGLVTFTESYVFKSRATLAQYEARANTIMHEMAHMWFGDLVTMFWWDDLWLKESFADYMGALAVAEALDSPTSWVTFANRRKSWAYVQDQLPSTHPIVADIVDLEAAKLNFDGITYAKGASVVKQLVAYAGFDAFTQAARAYFRTHAFGNTSLGDFLAALSTASGQDMSVWARQWLQTSGVPRLSSEVDVNDDGNYTSVLIRQSAVDPVTGETELRPHSLRLGLYTRDKENQLVRTGSVEVQVSGAATEIPELVGTAQPDLLLINDDDLSYALLEFDERSLETLLTGVDRLEEPLARAVCLAALWSNTRDAVLTAHEYVAVVQRAALPETGVGVLQIILQNAAYAIEHFAAPAGRERLRKSFAGFVVNGLHAAKPASDHQLVWARTAAALGRKTARHSELLRGLLDGGVSIDGLAVDAELRWLLWRALAAQGLADETELGAELERDNTGSGTVGFTTARSSMPRAEIKEEAWRAALSNTLSNDLLSATISGFQEGPLGLHEPYVEPYFREISRVWGSLGIEMSSRIVRELFPASQDMVLGSTPEDHPVVNRTDRWLERNVNAAGALRRIILEERDQLLRSLRAQAREASLTVQGTR